MLKQRLRYWISGAILLLAAVALAWGTLKSSGPVLSSESSRVAFAGRALPAETTLELMDIGVADINGDERFDIFTSNHNSRQNLWVADDRGGYRDMLSAWGLDQDPALPGIEISAIEPVVAEPGVYIYWKGRNERSQFVLVVRGHRLSEIGRLEGIIRTFSGVRRTESSRFALQGPTSARVADSLMPETTLRFSSERDGTLEIEVVSPGAPLEIQIDGAIPSKNIYLGIHRVRPPSNRFELAFQDRHGMAWIDYNDDGWLDAFVSRGAIGGTLRMYPPSVQSRVFDELLVSEPDRRYRNVSNSVGIDKRGCSGRKAAWVDFNGDGLADLFVNCQERGFAAGAYPKQLYRQGSNQDFTDVASEVGLDLSDHEIVDFVWFDADGDGFVDLLTHEAKGFFLYRNRRGKSFSPEFIGRGRFVRADNPQLRGTTDEYWFVDGKLSAADFDGNGSIDAFCASKRGNALLVNDGKGSFMLIDPETRGLPGESATGGWVDVDNDGRLDLFSVPQGIYVQRRDHSFESTGLLALPYRKHMAAIVTWVDLDNDGRRDVLMALLENFSLWTWWEKLFRTNADRFRWSLRSYSQLDSKKPLVAGETRRKQCKSIGDRRAGLRRNLGWAADPSGGSERWSFFFSGALPALFRPRFPHKG